MKLCIALGISLFLLKSQDPPIPWPALKPVLLARGFDYPVDIQSPLDGSGRLFIVEQAGRIRIWQNGRILDEPFLDIRPKVRSGGERGLLGLAFSPAFRENGTFYLNYTEGSGAPDLRTVLARYRISAADPNRADPASEERLLLVDQPYDNHNAGQLAFSPRDNFLYFGLGDGGGGGDPQNNAQNPSRLLGKMLRLDVERQSRPTPEIWATGLRNPWRYSFDRLTHDLWIADVGQNRFEEIDFQPASASAGLNYGWNLMEASSCYQPGCNPAGLTPPVFEYGRSLGASVSGGYVYRGSVYPSRLGIYFLADYVSGRFWGLRPDGAQWASRDLGVLPGWNISTFGQGEDGELYVATHAPRDGAVYRLADVSPVTRADLVVNAATGEPGAVPGARINVYGWGIIDDAGNTQLLFDGLPAQIVSAENRGGQELIVAVVPTALAGRTSSRVIVAAGAGRSAVVEVPVPAVQPGIFDLGYQSEPGGSIDLLVTGLGTCAHQFDATVAFQPAALLGCQDSPYHAGAQLVTIVSPGALPAGEYTVSLSASGVLSRPVPLRLR